MISKWITQWLFTRFTNVSFLFFFFFVFPLQTLAITFNNKFLFIFNQRRQKKNKNNKKKEREKKTQNHSSVKKCNREVVEIQQKKKRKRKRKKIKPTTEWTLSGTVNRAKWNVKTKNQKHISCLFLLLLLFNAITFQLRFKWNQMKSAKQPKQQPNNVVCNNSNTNQQKKTSWGFALKQMHEKKINENNQRKLVKMRYIYTHTYTQHIAKLEEIVLN